MGRGKNVLSKREQKKEKYIQKKRETRKENVETMLIFDKTRLRITRKRLLAVTGASIGYCYHLWGRVPGGLGEQGGHAAAPTVCLGTGMKSSVPLLDYMWLSHTVCRMQEDTYCMNMHLALGGCRAFPKDPHF